MRNTLFFWSLLFWVGCLFAGCKYFKSKEKIDDLLLAKVDDNYLYMSDIASLLKNVAKEDSAKFVFNYTNNWARKKLLVEKAEENISAGDIELEEKVEEYRQSLLLYEYEKELINQKLDNAISDSEVEDYYTKNKENLKLESDIYLVKYVRINPNEEGFAAQKNSLLNPKDEAELIQAKGYCKAHAISYNIDGIWLSLKSIERDFPLSDSLAMIIADSKSTKELPDENNVLLFTIKEKISKNETAPLSFIKPTIKELLINKKKVKLIESIYDKIYEDGIKNKNCEIYVK